MNDGTQVVLTPLPCPFCGRAPEVGEHRTEDGGYSAIECHHAGSGLFCGVHADDYAACLELWNKRADLAAPAAPDVSAFQKAWNDNRGPLPQVTKLVGDRLQKLRRRIKEGLTLEDFRKAAWTCSHTVFLLQGTPGKPFHATFDWLVSTSGIIPKVLDGTYGPTGQTEEELLAEKASGTSEEQMQNHRLMSHMSQRIADGIRYTPDLERNVRVWEGKATDALEEMRRGRKYPVALAELLLAWEQKRANGVTITNTATSL